MLALGTSEASHLKAEQLPFQNSQRNKFLLYTIDRIMKRNSSGDVRGFKRRKLAHRKPKCIKRSHDALLIAWRGSQKHVPGTCYHIEVRRHLESTWRTASEAYPGERIWISHLQSHTVYLVRIRARCGPHYSKWSDEAMFETLAQNHLRSIENVDVHATNNSVSLFWKNECRSITSYDVHELRHGAWTTVLDAQEQFKMQAEFQRRAPGAVEEAVWFVRRNLLPGREYAFRIIAKEKENHYSSKPIHVKTESPVLSPPGPCDKEQHPTCSCDKFSQTDADCHCSSTASPCTDVNFEIPTVSPCSHVSAPMMPLALNCSEASPDSITIEWDGLMCPATTEYVVQTMQLGNFCLHPSWGEHRSQSSTLTLESLRSSTFYLVRVAPVCVICNNFISEVSSEPVALPALTHKFERQWSKVLVLPTKPMDNARVELQGKLQRILDCKRTSQMIISRLMKSHLTLDEVKKMPRRVLEQHLRELQVKEGGIFAVTYALHGKTLPCLTN
ncbi:hypothetical protein GUITHDRAFT_143758 [Guillardia theta CCMP2712]|uniref:Fibronectin type-III domain-containing protein n=1 Tax=Guillardia theta (strain CCMP2712) TaxID=905079 RepID=L1ISA8_GUITC|nr:hypothetical protein GUITHDRAFT_143758 [Guillardia theta CCMP2712]EKX39156.1 hypothetical protein GUITHDRAFT_143758 [Guillardia theta CCMP2712]|eukprot:XP_005826136.1 hypothetical protein GUITHDRAFT_143758 [Guillardia theta CCMP2712]